MSGDAGKERVVGRWKQLQTKLHFTRRAEGQNRLYVARRAECGCCLGIDRLSATATANAVAEWIADGLVVTHVSWDMYRNVILAEEHSLDCRMPERQLDFLFVSGVRIHR